MTNDKGMTKSEGPDVRAVPELKPQARTLWLEPKELHLIFAKFG